MLAASSHGRNSHPEREHITIAIDVRTAFLHADVDQDLFAEPPELDIWHDAALRYDEVWKLNKALCCHRKAPKLWHQHVVSMTDPSCFRNDELNVNIFIHVDDGLLFGPKIEVLQLVELLSKQILMRIVGRMEKRCNTIFFLGRVIERTARGYSVEANPRRDCCAWSGRLETSVDSKREEDANDRVELETEASRVHNSCGKAVVHVPGAC